MQIFPKLSPLAKLYPDVYKRILLTVAAKNNDLNFLKYVLHKYKLQTKVLMEEFDLRKYLNKNEDELKFPLSASDFSKLAGGSKISIVNVVLTSPDTGEAKKGIRSFLEQKGLITAAEVKAAEALVATPPAPLTEDVETSTKAIYKKILGTHPALGDNAYIDPRNLVWGDTLPNKMKQQDADKYCSDLSKPALNIACHLPTKKEYKDLAADKAHEKLPNFSGKGFWSSSVYPRNPINAYIFDGSNGDVDVGYRSNALSLRCVCFGR
ncbi:MAG: DUF1566 domain-containing protein [Oligoflexia bacterium]|nr:DUF1566 domain-containing protein [Oligoflexia bacterium]